MASTCSKMRGNVISPVEVSSPSAIVVGSREGWKVLLVKDRKASSAPAGSAPTTQTSGLRALVARARPDSSPPPPTAQSGRQEVDQALELVPIILQQWYLDPQ